MTIKLQLADATGALFTRHNRDWAEDDEILTGFVRFEIPELTAGGGLKVAASAWLDCSKGPPELRLSIGGIPGAMCHVKSRGPIRGPHYVGAIGPRNELLVAGWRSTSNSSDAPAITLLIQSSFSVESLLTSIAAKGLDRI